MRAYLDNLRSVDWWITAIIGSVLLGAIGSLLAAFLKDGFDWSVKGWVAKVLAGRFASDRELSATWDTEFDYPRGGEIKKDDPTFRLWKLGSSIYGKGKSSIDGSTYHVQGELSGESFITGRWFERTKSGRHYYGAFQLFIRPTNDEMRGKWIGLSAESAVKSGDWVWKKRISNS